MRTYNCLIISKLISLSICYTRRNSNLQSITEIFLWMIRMILSKKANRPISNFWLWVILRYESMDLLFFIETYFRTLYDVSQNFHENEIPWRSWRYSSINHQFYPRFYLNQFVCQLLYYVRGYLQLYSSVADFRHWKIFPQVWLLLEYARGRIKVNQHRCIN